MGLRLDAAHILQKLKANSGLLKLYFFVVFPILCIDYDNIVLTKLLGSGNMATLLQQSQMEQETWTQTGLPGWYVLKHAAIHAEPWVF